MIEVLAHGQTVGFLSVVPFPGSESTFGGGDYALNHNLSVVFENFINKCLSCVSKLNK